MAAAKKQRRKAGEGNVDVTALRLKLEQIDGLTGPERKFLLERLPLPGKRGPKPDPDRSYRDMEISTLVALYKANKARTKGRTKAAINEIIKNSGIKRTTIRDAIQRYPSGLKIPAELLSDWTRVYEKFTATPRLSRESVTAALQALVEATVKTQSVDESFGPLVGPLEQALETLLKESN